MISREEERRHRVGLRRRIAQAWRKAPVWKRALMLLSALPALLLLENLLLWSKVIGLPIGFAPPVTFDYGFAWSIVPGRVHVYELEMTVEDRAIQMQLNADVVNARIILSGLWSKKLHFDGATAQASSLGFGPCLMRRRHAPSGSEHFLQSKAFLTPRCGAIPSGRNLPLKSCGR